MTGSFPQGPPQPPGQPPQAQDWPQDQYQNYGQPQDPYNVEEKSGGSRLLKIGPILLAIGLVLGVSLVVFGATSLPELETLPQATGEQQPVELTTGEWTVYAENGSNVPTIVGSGGESVAVQSSFTSSNYTIGGRSGVSVGKVDIQTADTYIVTSPAGQTTVFGQGLLSGIFRSVILIVIGALVGGSLVLAGLIMTILGLVRR